MKVLLTGAGGQLGRELQRLLAPRHQVTALMREQLDVRDAERTEALLQAERPDVVIHGAAFTDADRAEREVEHAYEVNAIGTWRLAQAVQLVDAKLVCLSTDQVFDGMKGAPYEEDDRPEPRSIYGQSKLLGEKLAAASCDKLFIVRTSWLYGASGSSWVTQAAQRALTEGKLTAEDDQYGSPTYVRDLAVLLEQLMASDKYGVYHAANAGWCSRYELARHLVTGLGLEPEVVTPVPSGERAFAAVSPPFSALAGKALAANGFQTLRDWKAGLDHFLQHDFGR
ncbi:dTDP-4-dehydrorhamnose reductase [Paenibacillus athensensis]|nr:dTDP-4-dehydrorhamnose reductase [Paenibacillus athensensis]MCD1258075.1 dTDP-4-dehydrorhamnose reductase [Paenibacillus athensensis]